VVKAAIEQVPYSDPSDPGNLMGPVISSRQRDRVLGYIDIGRKEGPEWSPVEGDRLTSRRVTSWRPLLSSRTSTTV
jgi:acyl-CoA reductase-like NAD-dependent aldehyde dehydrogenase